MCIGEQAETLEQKRKDSAARRKRKAAETAARRRRNSLGQGQRVEIWIAHDGQSSSENRIELDDEDDDSDDINSLPMVEVWFKSLLDVPTKYRSCGFI